MSNPNQIPKNSGPAGWAPGVMDPPPPYSASSGPYPQSSIPHQGQPTGYPQQPQGFPQVQTLIVNVNGFGPYPQSAFCTRCRTNVVSEVVSMPGFLTYLLSATLVVLGCWAGCCLIPCCVPEVQDCEHRCPNCKTKLGLYRRI
ncbi:LITAF domain-containing protein-like [Brevipalpus obovatus]|uniref:LITAF domain-containing protein-like n=1 Tax=Brevipalpus obovatus TaxID=246614 RepID=UPI003D9E38F1